MASHRLFFSSCFEDPIHSRLAIRDRVAGLNTSASKAVWLAEDFDVLKPAAPTPPFEKALFCVEGVRQSDIYVAVVRHRHGSGVEVSSTERVQTSYFELELFEAALLRKPAYVFLLKGAEPDERIAALLHLLKPAIPGICWTPLDEDEIFARVAGLLETQARPKLHPVLSRAEASDRRMSNQLTGQRHRLYDPRKEMPSVRFMGGLRDKAMPRPDHDVVERILNRVDSEQSYQVRLVLLWTVMRELMGAAPDLPNTQTFLPLWDRALGSWNSSGAWYGLHGHPVMGCLGALSSLAGVRDKLGNAGRPHGALSSEYYSIAKHVSSRALRAAVLTMSHRHIDAAFDDGETSGKLAMRGSVAAAMGDRANAITDYERVVYLRDNVEPATDAERGDARTELGFALVRSGDRRNGLALMEEGVALLAHSGPNGFLVRAKRKLGRAYLMSGAPRRALSTLADAFDIATELGALDQISQIDRIAKVVERRFRRN
ncbi:DUF4062 domain-containing protein [Brevundimonas sp.]|uniref:DUF4062 domain-containing protein n=1 Tax=Brevundimonas sp. TaxID=1871086 RepID=UPI002FC5FD09